MDSPAIERAVAMVGGQSELARLIGVAPQSVQQWVAAGRAPATRFQSIENATGGKVSRAELLDDLYVA